MRFIVLVVWCLVTAASAQDSALQRLETLDSLRNWRAVGRLDAAGRWFCTGTLITEDLVLTAAHCLSADGAEIDPEGIVFRVGLRRGSAQAMRSVRRIILHPGWSSDDGQPEHDLALAELDRPIRRAGLTPARTGRPVAKGAGVSVVSYATGRADVPSLQARCTVLARAAPVSVLSCSADFGASGAPVFAEGGIAAVITSISTYRGAKVSLAAELAPSLPPLLAAEAAGKGRWIHDASGPFQRIRPGQRRATGAKTIPARP